MMRMQWCNDTCLHATESVFPPLGLHSISLTSLCDSWVRMHGSFPSVQKKMFYFTSMRVCIHKNLKDVEKETDKKNKKNQQNQQKNSKYFNECYWPESS